MLAIIKKKLKLQNSGYIFQEKEFLFNVKKLIVLLYLIEFSNVLKLICTYQNTCYISLKVYWQEGYDYH